VASSKSRQRELARAKYHRQVARKAAAQRRRRQVWAGVSAGAVVLLVAVGTFWLTGAFERDKKPAAADVCAWTPANSSGNPDIKDVGTPPTSGIPVSGTRPMNIALPEGNVTVEMDLTRAPCTAASFAYLASKNFFDNTKCHRLLSQGDYVLQCGDPAGKGTGGPSYTFADENLPTPTPPSAAPSGSAAPDQSNTYVYPKGTVAMANSGPNTNGSQFFIVYRDSPFPANYAIFGQVVAGLDVIEKIAAQGTDDNGQGEKSKPKKDVVIQTLTVGEVQNTPGPTLPPAPSGPATPTGPVATSATPKS
jgi:peptidyl-prolyl cis-trans isomerase B (cyclophilin B)